MLKNQQICCGKEDRCWSWQTYCSISFSLTMSLFRQLADVPCIRNLSFRGAESDYFIQHVKTETNKQRDE